MGKRLPAVLLALGITAAAVAQPPAAEPDVTALPELEARYRTLAGRPDAEDAASEALQHARLALARARRLTRPVDAAASERARQIAAAALSLAARQIERLRAERALRSVERRLETAEARSRRARNDLNAALAHRAEALRPDEPLGQPPSAAPQGQGGDDGEGEPEGGESP